MAATQSRLGEREIGDGEIGVDRHAGHVLLDRKWSSVSLERENPGLDHQPWVDGVKQGSLWRRMVGSVSGRGRTGRRPRVTSIGKARIRREFAGSRRREAGALRGKLRGEGCEARASAQTRTGWEMMLGIAARGTDVGRNGGREALGKRPMGRRERAIGGEIAKRN